MYQIDHGLKVKGTCGGGGTCQQNTHLYVYFFSFAEKGIRLVNDGQYSEAVNMFTEAIKYDPKDYRFLYLFYLDHKY